MKSRVYLSVFIVALSAGIFFSAPIETFAQQQTGDLTYTPLEPIPGFNATGQGTLGELLKNVFRLLFILGALLAIVRMVVGGIMYMVSEVVETKGQAKKWMTSSLWGLAILAGAWLILNTINPNLLNFTFDPTLGGVAPQSNLASSRSTGNSPSPGGPPCNWGSGSGQQGSGPLEVRTSIIRTMPANSTCGQYLAGARNAPLINTSASGEAVLMLDTTNRSVAYFKNHIDTFRRRCRSNNGSMQPVSTDVPNTAMYICAQ